MTSALTESTLPTAPATSERGSSSVTDATRASMVTPPADGLDVIDTSMSARTNRARLRASGKVNMVPDRLRDDD